MKKFNRIAIVFLLLLQTSFFSFLPTNKTLFLINSSVYKTLIIFLIFCVLVLNVIFNYQKLEEPRQRIFLPMILSWILIYFGIMWASQIIYNQSLVTTLKNSYIYFMVAEYFFLSFFFFDYDDFKLLLKSISIIGSIYAAILLVQAWMFQRNRVFLDLGAYGLNPIYDSFGPVFHFIRIAIPADFISFSFLITCIYFLYSHKKKPLITAFLLVIDLLYIVFVSGTRMYMIIDLLILAGLILIILFERTPGISYILGSGGALSALIVIPLLVKVFTSGERGASFSIRLNEIQYYLDKIFYNKWFGLGFPDASRFDQLLHGPQKLHVTLTNANYFIEDIGVLGVLSIFGVLGLVAISWFAINLIKAFIASSYKSAVFLIIIYLLAMIPTLSLIDPQRIMYLFILIYIIEYLTSNQQKRENPSYDFSTYTNN